jgi:hypothetical protein
MAEETARPRPLDSEEIKNGIAQMVADAVYDELTKTCNLYGHSYPKFKGTVTIHLELDDFGLVANENRTVLVEGGEGTIGPVSIPVDAKVEIAEMPPNEFRMETGQPITRSVLEDGKATTKKIHYKPRKKHAGVKKTSAPVVESKASA